MKVVIFAGGLGTRISEESYLKPKPMIEIGEKPMLWHIMKVFEAQGFNEFIICLGYKGHMIKEYFMNYYVYNSDVTFNLKTNSFEIHQTNTEKFRVTLVETGLNTLTAGRLKRVEQYVGKEEFILTYGDGLADVDLEKLISFHRSHGKVATVTWRSSRRGVSGFWGWTTTAASPASRRSRSVTAAGSTEGSSCCAPRCSPIFRPMRTSRCGSRPRWRGFPRKTSSWLTSTTASGSAWMRCATKRI